MGTRLSGQWSAWVDRALRAAEAMGEATVPAEHTASGQEAWLSTPHVDAGRASHPAVAASERPSAPLRLIWPVRDRSTFAALRGGVRARRGPLTVTFLAEGGSERARVAYAVSHRVGSAAVRNRLRRQLRQIVRRLPLAPGAYLVGVGPEAAGRRSDELETWLLAALAGTRARSAGGEGHG